MKVTIYLSDGSVFVTNYPEIPPVEEKPTRYSYPVGWHVTILDMKNGRIPIFVKHDKIYDRSLNLKYTNETFPFVEYDPINDTVYPQGKITVKLERFREWIYEFERHLGARILWLFVQPGFGWCDTDEKNTDPYYDNVHFQVIDCGGNRREMNKIVIKNGVKYAVCNYQDAQNGPNQTMNYENSPQFYIKQVDVGDVGNGIFWRTSSVGDCIFPLVSNKPIAHKYLNVAEYPMLPFDAKLDGYDVHVLEYCFQGSKTFVLVNGGELETGWYLAEEMNVPADRKEPDPGNDRDYIRHIEHPDWPNGCLPPIANWKKEYSLLGLFLNWIKSLISF